jgi:23S rRNA (cytosine1962-C5)-methyltransferase
MMERAKIILKSGKDQSLQRFHPWVFSGAIKKIYGTAREGEIVDVFNNKDEYLATGHYQESSIAVRVLSFKQEIIDEAFWRKELRVPSRCAKEPDLLIAVTPVFTG